MKSLPIHQQLRVATDDLHQRVDREAGELDLGTPGGLQAFLNMMVRGLSAIEPALERAEVSAVYPQWPRRRRLQAACDELGTDAQKSAERPLSLVSESEVWGALYVLEGSRLGSRLLVRQAPESPFLRISADDRSWPDFLAALGKADERLNDADGMIKGATKTFEAFLR